MGTAAVVAGAIAPAEDWGRMGRVTVLVAVGSSRRRRKKPALAGRGSIRVVPTKPSGTVVGAVKAGSVAMESTR